MFILRLRLPRLSPSREPALFKSHFAQPTLRSRCETPGGAGGSRRGGCGVTGWGRGSLGAAMATGTASNPREWATGSGTAMAATGQHLAHEHLAHTREPLARSLGSQEQSLPLPATKANTTFSNMGAKYVTKPVPGAVGGRSRGGPEPVLTGA